MRLARSGRRAKGRSGTLWALDLETTGLDPGVDHIIEVGLVPIIDRRVLLGRAWSSLIRPLDYRANGTVAHRIMPVDLDDAAPADEVARRLWLAVGDDRLLVHHAKLDLAFLRNLQRRLGRPWPRPEVVDTVDLLTRRNRRLRQLGEPPLPLQLGEARRALGLPDASEHRALDDAVATAELWLALTSPEHQRLRR